MNPFLVNASSMKSAKTKWLLLLVLGVLIFFLFRAAPDWISLEKLKENREALVIAYEARPVLGIILYLGFYVLMCALSIPGATLITLAGGAIFGLGLGTLIVSFGSSIGAVLAFLGARYFFRETFETKFGERVKSVDEGLKRDGTSYLFSLRLLPIFPFWLVNILMGLTSFPVLKYYWVSQIGMLPSTVIYVNAGTRLAEIDRLKDVLDPSLLLSLVALGLFPWVAKIIMNAWKMQKLFGPYVKPTTFDYNLEIGRAHV